MQKAAHAGNVTGRTALIGILAAAVSLAADQTTKYLFWNSPAMQSGDFYYSFIGLVAHRNPGALADVPVPLILIVLISLALIGLIVGAIIKAVRADDQRAAGSLGLMLGGALGNIFDRITLGYVRDWILLFGRSAINLADVAIALGLLWYLIHIREQSKKTPAT